MLNELLKTFLKSRVCIKIVINVSAYYLLVNPHSHLLGYLFDDVLMMLQIGICSRSPTLMAHEAFTERFYLFQSVAFFLELKSL